MDFVIKPWLLTALVVAFSAPAAAITVDGRLDEADWAAAPVFSDFRVADPLTMEIPRFPMQVRMLARHEGLYFGFTVHSPPSMRTYGRSPRDSHPMDADSVTVVIDFEGQGRTAYEFTVSLSNSERDGIVIDQTQQIYDWDATWLHEISEDDTAWYAEILIPWSAAPMHEIDAATRKIGVWFQSFNRKLAQGISSPPMSTGRPTFVQDMRRVDVPRFPTDSLAFAPYVSVGKDLLRDATRVRAGADFFWKPNGENQLTATINPEFGQVEADDIVANYTPIETFFTEKRPFFNEGESLFDVRTLQNGRLVYTRRIGDAPDAGSEPHTDIIAAAKYTGLAGPLEYGAFGTVEDNSSRAQGRKYGVVRGRYTSDQVALGYLATYVNRPTLDRRAAVQAVDASWLPLNALAITAQAISTSIRQHPTLIDPSGRDSQGFGAWLQAAYAPGGIFEQDVRLLWLDRHYDIDDLGYMERNSLHQVEWVSYLFKRLYPETSSIYNSNWYLDIRYRENDTGERLTTYAEVARFWRFRNWGSAFVYGGTYSTGIDDLIAPALGAVPLPTQRFIGFNWKAEQNSRFHHYLEVDYNQEGISGWAFEIISRPTVFISPDLNLGLEADFISSPDWLVYRYTQATLGRFSRRQFLSALKINWYPARKQELRVKLEWLGTQARASDAYGLDAERRLVPDPGRPLSDFSVSTLGFQVRYRFELAPLSDLFLVYSRAGADSRDDDVGDFGHQFRSTVSQRSGDEFFVKLSYRF